MSPIYMKRSEYTQFYVLYTMKVVTEPWRVFPICVGRLNACELRLRAHTLRAPSLTPNAVLELKLQLLYCSKEQTILYKTGPLASLFGEKCVRRKRQTLNLYISAKRKNVLRFQVECLQRVRFCRTFFTASEKNEQFSRNDQKRVCDPRVARFVTALGSQTWAIEQGKVAKTQLTPCSEVCGLFEHLSEKSG